MSTHVNEGTPLKPNTAYDPLLRFIFREQERRAIRTVFLAKLTGMSYKRISQLRHPTSHGGKTPTLREVRLLAESLDLRFPDTLRQNGD